MRVFYHTLNKFLILYLQQILRLFDNNFKGLKGKHLNPNQIIA